MDKSRSYILLVQVYSINEDKHYYFLTSTKKGFKEKFESNKLLKQLSHIILWLAVDDANKLKHIVINELKKCDNVKINDNFIECDNEEIITKLIDKHYY